MASIVREMKEAIAQTLEQVVTVTTEINMADMTFEEVNRSEMLPERGLPAASIILGFVDISEYSTEYDQATWRFVVRLYYDLSKGIAAQDEYEEMLPEVLRAFRYNQQLGGLCDRIRIQDAGDPVFSRGTNLLIKTINLIPETDEN